MSSCSRCTDRLKNSGCWHLNEINDSVHQDHVACECGDLPSQDVQACSICTACLSVIPCYKSCCSTLHSFNLIEFHCHCLRKHIIPKYQFPFSVTQLNFKQRCFNQFSAFIRAVKFKLKGTTSPEYVLLRHESRNKEQSIAN